ncbi:MAG: AAA family ATPase [Woeseiaceae bacterium]|nr:AAA family ATPase [Woeseiaceae bacterium]
MSMTSKPTAHLLHGYIGSGKTTFARKLEREHGAVRFSHDEWMVRLHGWNPPAEQFAERMAQVMNLIWDEATRELEAGNDVILDFGFWTRESRDAARRRVSSIGAVAKFYSFFCPKSIMKARTLERSKRPSTDSLWIDEPAFDKLLARFEPMDDDEEYVRVDGTR